MENRTREVLFTRLARIDAIARRTGHLARMILYGSFVTSKPEPNDIDVFLVFKTISQSPLPRKGRLASIR